MSDLPVFHALAPEERDRLEADCPVDRAALAVEGAVWAAMERGPRRIPVLLHLRIHPNGPARRRALAPEAIPAARQAGVRWNGTKRDVVGAVLDLSLDAEALAQDPQPDLPALCTAAVARAAAPAEAARVATARAVLRLSGQDLGRGIWLRRMGQDGINTDLAEALRPLLETVLMLLMTKARKTEISADSPHAMADRALQAGLAPEARLRLSRARRIAAACPDAPAFRSALRAPAKGTLETGRDQVLRDADVPPALDRRTGAHARLAAAAKAQEEPANRPHAAARKIARLLASGGRRPHLLHDPREIRRIGGDASGPTDLPSGTKDRSR